MDFVCHGFLLADRFATCLQLDETCIEPKHASLLETESPFEGPRFGGVIKICRGMPCEHSGNHVFAGGGGGVADSDCTQDPKGRWLHNRPQVSIMPPKKTTPLQMMFFLFGSVLKVQASTPWYPSSIAQASYFSPTVSAIDRHERGEASECQQSDK